MIAPVNRRVIVVEEKPPDGPAAFLESEDGPLASVLKVFLGLYLLLILMAWVTVLPILGLWFLIFG